MFDQKSFRVTFVQRDQIDKRVKSARPVFSLELPFGPLGVKSLCVCEPTVIHVKVFNFNANVPINKHFILFIFMIMPIPPVRI